jgi:hypothetical protein
MLPSTFVSTDCKASPRQNSSAHQAWHLFIDKADFALSNHVVQRQQFDGSKDIQELNNASGVQSHARWSSSSRSIDGAKRSMAACELATGPWWKGSCRSPRRVGSPWKALEDWKSCCNHTRPWMPLWLDVIDLELFLVPSETARRHCSGVHHGSTSSWSVMGSFFCSSRKGKVLVHVWFAFFLADYFANSYNLWVVEG